MLKLGLLLASKSHGFISSSSNISTPSTWKHFPFYLGKVAWQQYFKKGKIPVRYFCVRVIIFSFSYSTLTPFWAKSSKTTLRQRLLPLPKGYVLLTNLGLFLFKLQLVKCMQAFLKFSFVGYSQSYVQNLARPSQFKKHIQGSIEAIRTYNLRSNFFFYNSRGFPIYGWTIHQVEPVFGIYDSFFIRLIPSPWQPADGFNISILPSFIFCSSFV